MYSFSHSHGRVSRQGAHWRNADASFRTWNTSVGHPTPSLHGGRCGVKRDPFELAEDEVIAEAQRRLRDNTPAAPFVTAPNDASDARDIARAAAADAGSGSGVGSIVVGSRVRVVGLTGRQQSLNGALATVKQLLRCACACVPVCLCLCLCACVPVCLCVPVCACVCA
jgi:hypothetical protein